MTAWKAALRRAGITRHIRPYDLRHAFATEAIRAGADYGTVAVLMGHSSPVMVMRHYQHVCNEQKMEAIEAIPSATVRGACARMCTPPCAQIKKDYDRSHNPLISLVGSTGLEPVAPAL